VNRYGPQFRERGGHMRVLTVVVLLCLVLAGCSAADTLTQSTAGDVSGNAETPADAQLAPDDPSLPHSDELGRTPDQVVLALVDAANSQDWSAMYSLYAEPEVDLQTASSEWAAAAERYDDFAVKEVRVVNKDKALVRVTYRCETTPPGGDRYPVVVADPGEWWRVARVEGVWKVVWLPRQ
jgi:hypothetical protein